MHRLGLVLGMILSALGVILSLQTALAAEPAFPAGSRIGLIPPADMTASKRFSGFENKEKESGISFVEMDPGAYPKLLLTLTDPALKRQGMNVTRRESLKLGTRPAMLISGTMAGDVGGRKWVLAVDDPGLTALVIAQVPGGRDGYSDDAIRDALKSVALRGPVSIDEQVAALPFHIGDRAGFRPVRSVAGNAILFTDGPKDDPKAAEQPILVLAAASVTSQAQNGWDQFAKGMLNANPLIRDIVIERSESFRTQGQDWQEIVARAADAGTGQPVIVMQTLRIDANRLIRLVGMTQPDQRDRDLSRFRKVIDSITVDP